MRKAISILILVATASLVGCIQKQSGDVHPVVVDAKHFYPERTESKSVLGLLKYEEVILPDRYVVEIYDKTDGFYHFVRVCKPFWAEVEPGDTLYYNDTTRILKFSK